MQALFSWEYTHQDKNELSLFNWLDEERRSTYGSDTITFARLLTQGSLEHLEEIDQLLQRQLEHWDFSRLNKVDLAILRISIYALLHQPEIPYKVTIDEAISLAKMYGSDESYRFVNGVLDGVSKQIRESI